jgi:hypothetical protein
VLSVSAPYFSNKVRFFRSPAGAEQHPSPSGPSIADTFALERQLTTTLLQDALISKGRDCQKIHRDLFIRFSRRVRLVW